MLTYKFKRTLRLLSRKRFGQYLHVPRGNAENPSSPPRSQLLYFIMAAFLVFNWFRLVVGATFDWSCDHNVQEVITAAFDPSNGAVMFSNNQVVATHWRAAKPRLKVRVLMPSGCHHRQRDEPGRLLGSRDRQGSKHHHLPRFVMMTIDKTRNNYREALSVEDIRLEGFGLQVPSA